MAKVPFPNAYASAEEAKASKEKHVFNCAQRAHANFLEHWEIMLVGMGVSGISCGFFPVFTLRRFETCEMDMAGIKGGGGKKGWP